MPARRIGRGLVHPLIQRLVDRELQIDNRSTAFADEVVVGIDVGIKTVIGAAEIDLLDESLINQDVEVPVNRTHTKVRELRLQPFVDPIGRRMPPAPLEQLEDSLPLPAPLVRAVLFDLFAPDK